MGQVSLIALTCISLVIPCISRGQGIEYVGASLFGSVDIAGVSGSYIHCIGGQIDQLNNIYTISITDPARPQLLGGYINNDYWFDDAYFTDTVAYIGVHDIGFMIMNMADPWNPVPILLSDSIGIGSVTISAHDSYIYMSYFGTMLEIMDISDMSSPRILGSVPGCSQNVFVEGDYAYVSCINQFSTIDISNPSNPYILSSFDIGRDYYIVGIKVIGNIAYITAYDLLTPEPPPYIHESKFVTLDISNPTYPESLGAYHAYPERSGGLDVEGSYAYVSFGDSTKIFNISNPSILVPLSIYPHGGRPTINNDTLYVTNGNLYIADVSDKTSPRTVSSFLETGNPYDVELSGIYAYVVCDDAGLYVLDIQNPSRPLVLANYRTGNGMVEIHINGAYAYIAERQHVLRVFNISNPNGPLLIDSTSLGGFPGEITSDGNFLYVACTGYPGAGCVFVYNIFDPSNLYLAGSFVSPEAIADIQISNQIAYLACSNYGFKTLDISSPERPSLLGYCSITGRAWKVAVYNNNAFVASDSGLFILDTSDPSSPSVVNNVRTGRLSSIEVYGEYLYAAAPQHSTFFQGMKVFNISNPINPDFLAQRYTNGPLNLYINGNYIYSTNWHYLEIMRFNTTGINDDSHALPLSPSLSQNYPNPFNASTIISYSLPQAGEVTIDIFDITGRKIETLLSGYGQAGGQSIAWNAQGVSSGVYFYRIKAGEFQISRKCLLLK